MKVLLGTWRDHRIELDAADIAKLKAGHVLTGGGIEVKMTGKKFAEMPRAPDGRRQFMQE